MQEVFEKIKNNLEREILGKPTPEEFDNAIYKAIKIVNQVAEEYNNKFEPALDILEYGVDGYNLHLKEQYQKGYEDAKKEYNNGWIPVEEKLPEERVAVDITIMEDANEVGGKRYYNVRTWLQDGQFRFKKNPYNQVVIAWKYPTEPYQPKGDKE